MFGLADRGNKNKVKELGVGSVLVQLNVHGYDRQEATDQWKAKMLVKKPKQELQLDLWTKVTNTTTYSLYEKLTSDNDKRRIFLKWQ